MLPVVMVRLGLSKPTILIIMNMVVMPIGYENRKYYEPTILTSHDHYEHGCHDDS